MDKEESKKINFRFAKINTSKFSQFDLEKEFDKTEEPLTNFNSSFQFKVEPTTETVSCKVSVKVSIIETKELFCELIVENDFIVKPLNEIIRGKHDEIEGDSYGLPTEVLRTIVSLSISTVRGILYEKLKGTIIQDEIYPIINPSTLFDTKE